MVKTFENVPSHLMPLQRLFLSADIVGSTALKQRASMTSDGVMMSTSQTWFDAIQGFYIKAVQSFLGKWIVAQQECEEDDCDMLFGPEPLLWKTRGDEILFRKDITNHRQIAATINSWTTAMSEVRDFLKSANVKLDVKSTAWLAEFPLQNKLVIRPGPGVSRSLDPKNMETVGEVIKQYEGGELHDSVSVDFIGPAIDVGFRISESSTNRKFVISLDVAYLLAVNDDETTPKIYYDGMKQLKGVLDGMQYPVFWIDASAASPIDRAEDELITRKSCDFDDVSRFCSAFYNEISHYAHKPFIVSDTDPKLRRPPRGYQELHAAVVDQYS